MSHQQTKQSANSQNKAAPSQENAGLAVTKGVTALRCLTLCSTHSTHFAKVYGSGAFVLRLPCLDCAAAFSTMETRSVRRCTKTLTGSEFLAISPLQQVQRALIEARMADKHRDSIGLTAKRRSSSCIDPLAAAKHKLANATPKGSLDDFHNRDMTTEVKTACLFAS
jgi:hypothetical protein